jgi:isocitrate lyase
MTTFADLVPSPAGRFDGIERPYTPEDVLRLRGSVPITHTLAERGANRLWQLLHDEPFINALGAVTGNQAMQMVRAGLKAIYLSGWQVAADANTAGAMYPDQSLYPANAAPELCRRINRTLQRADQIEHAEGGAKRDWFVPIVADADSDLATAAALVRTHGVRRLPVVDSSGNLLGIVTVDELLILVGRTLSDLCAGIEEGADASESR